jgi:uncharacterized protein (TIRG00374 family)
MLAAHWVRAYRWGIMLKPLGYPLHTFRTFNAVMVGYIANLFVPRMGEITRCGVLKKTDNVNMTASIGSVVAERIIDLLTLISLILLNLVLEYDLLVNFFKDLFNTKFSGIVQNLYAIYILAGVGFLGLVALYLILRVYKEKLKRIPLFLKIRNILRELVDGMMSIRKIENKIGFWLSTFLLWGLYYALTYIVIFSIEETSGLSLLAGLTILVTGSIGMATPVQGGIGAFHVLVSSVLVLYGVNLDDGLLFATVLHSSQVLAVLVFGSISMIVTVLLQNKKQANDNRTDNQ